jgi:hypothetical protein
MASATCCCLHERVCWTTNPVHEFCFFKRVAEDDTVPKLVPCMLCRKTFSVLACCIDLRGAPWRHHSFRLPFSNKFGNGIGVGPITPGASSRSIAASCWRSAFPTLHCNPLLPAGELAGLSECQTTARKVFNCPWGKSGAYLRHYHLCIASLVGALYVQFDMYSVYLARTYVVWTYVSQDLF